jgi:hypothetical protein
MLKPIRPVALVALLALGLPAASRATTYNVTNTSDTGAGSLRQAILDANASMGLDTIAFAIPGSGVQTITVTTQLPTITDPVILDGDTQPGFGGSPLIELTSNASPTVGISVTAGASTIRGLVIHGFGTNVQVQSGGDNIVEGCYIGTDATGTVGSSGNGLIVLSSANLVGGADPAERNIVGGGNIAIQVSSGDGNVVRGNYVGVGLSGAAALGGGIATGIYVFGASNTLVVDNLVGGCSVSGITVASVGTGNILQGNRIGVDASGTQSIPNNVGITVSSPGILIGGSAPGEGNLVSGNTSTGILLNPGATGTIIRGNLIGTDASSVLPLGNSGNVIFNDTSVSDNVLGGVGAGEGNVIAFSRNFAGVWNYGVRNRIRGNSIHDNVGLGIENYPPGVDPNDPGDGDTGANDLQNFPVLSSVTHLAPQGGGTRIQGALHSMPSTTYDLDFYANPACSNFPREFLEGQTYLGSSQATTDGAGNATFDVTLPVSTVAGARISATATDPSGNTSEFSQRLPFSVAPASGPSAGGTAIVVSGTDFANGATVTIGGQPATSVNVNSYASISASTPALAAGTANDLVVTNTDGTNGTLVKGFVADFLDVPPANQFYTYVTRLVSNAITAGVGGGLYGVNDSTLRQQMAVFLLKAKFGVCYTPPPCTGIFTDVPCPSTFANWIEALSAEGITGGCGGTNYCPQNPVRRDQMAVFLLKAEHGPGYAPPMCSGTFADVPCPSTFADWIEQLAAEMITGGCGGGNYCPLNPNTRGQMAVFISKTFDLQ